MKEKAARKRQATTHLIKSQIIMTSTTAEIPATAQAEAEAEADAIQQIH